MTIQDSAAELLRDARRVVVFTGAGVSAESGVPTFRSAANALWNEVDVRNFAYPDGYRHNQPNAWRWYAERAAKAREVVPNAGHGAIAEIERRVEEFLLVTQNIDSLHQRAGNRNVLEQARAAAASCDVLLSVGTSNVVWPATEVPRYALRGGARVVVVNPDMEGQPWGHHVTQVVGTSGEALPQLVRLAWPHPDA